jgi:hypothetical protein
MLIKQIKQSLHQILNEISHTRQIIQKLNSCKGHVIHKVLSKEVKDLFRGPNTSFHRLD